jgi:cytochrome c oxidase subunit 2
MDGADLVGPTWLDLYGTERTLEDGTTVMVDEEYLRRAIMDPNSQVAAGYPQIMPVYESVLTDEELEGLVEYIKSVHD